MAPVGEPGEPCTAEHRAEVREWLRRDQGWGPAGCRMRLRGRGWRLVHSNGSQGLYGGPDLRWAWDDSSPSRLTPAICGSIVPLARPAQTPRPPSARCTCPGTAPRYPREMHLSHVREPSDHVTAGDTPSPSAGRKRDQRIIRYRQRAIDPRYRGVLVSLHRDCPHGTEVGYIEFGCRCIDLGTPRTPSPTAPTPRSPSSTTRTSCSPSERTPATHLRTADPSRPHPRK